MFARIARLVAAHPERILIAWLLVAIAAAPLASRAPRALTADTGTVRDSEAKAVSRVLETRFGQDIVDRTLVVTESTVPATDPAFRAAYDRLIARLRATDGVKSVTRFDDPSPLKLRSDDARVTATLLDTRLDHPDPVIEAVRSEARAAKLPGAKVYVTGATAITKDFLELTESDTKRSEFAALPITAIVLVAAFGALVAAGLPLVTGVLSITVSMALLWGLTHFMPVSNFAQSVITMLGLGAGIDYALLMVTRFREELAAGHDARLAAANTVRTAGRSVAFSGLTVAIAFAALLIPELTFVRSMGVGGVMVVLVTVLAAVTAVPAMLALLGERVNAPRVFRLRATRGRGVAFWGAWADRVMRRPWVSALAVIAALLFVARPALDMRLGYTGAFGLAPGVESRRGLELIRPLDLGGSLDTFEVLVDLGRSNAYDADARSKLRRLDAALVAMPDVRLVIDPFLVGRADTPAAGGSVADLVSLVQRSVSDDRRYLRLSVIPRDPVHPQDIAGWESRLRAAALEAGFTEVRLGGAPVGAREFTQALVGAMPLAVAVVFVATFVLLAVAFRSLVVPLKSIVMNSLTVAASYGVITLIFQEGWLAALFNVPRDVGAIDSSLPLMMFAVTFGLSMDYEIFLLSRVQEAHLAGLSTRAAVRTAVERTAGVITSAALIMLIVFLAFVRGDVVANKTIGLGLAVAVLLDATLVRLVLVPAVLVLAGEWNWWLPEPLRRVLPRVSLEHERSAG